MQYDGQLFSVWGEKEGVFVWTSLTACTAFIDPFLLPLHTRALDIKGLETMKNIPR